MQSVLNRHHTDLSVATVFFTFPAGGGSACNCSVHWVTLLSPSFKIGEP